MNLGSDTAQLLQIAVGAFDEEILDGTEGRARYAALMIRSAIAMAQREVTARGQFEAATDEIISAYEKMAGVSIVNAAALAAAIREGKCDATAILHRALWAHAALLASVTKPAALSRIERQIADLEDGELS